jgi:hypothetical protein
MYDFNADFAIWLLLPRFELVEQSEQPYRTI